MLLIGAKMNRKGHLGTLLLVFGALILVGYALFVMIGFNGNINEKENELKELSDKSSFTHEQILLESVKEMVLESVEVSKDNNADEFEKSFNDFFMELALQERASGLNTNIYAKISMGDYSLDFDGSKYELIIYDVFENYASGLNEARFLYSLRVLFDRERVISIETFNL